MHFKVISGDGHSRQVSCPCGSNAGPTDHLNSASVPTISSCVITGGTLSLSSDTSHLNTRRCLGWVFAKAPSCSKRLLSSTTSKGFSGGASGKDPAWQCRTHQRLRFNPRVRKTPWKRAGQPTPVFLPGDSHGRRSLEGYSPQGHRE